jgi:hypothetical protein
MNQKINNRLAFDFYVWIHFILLIIAIVYISALFVELKLGYKDIFLHSFVFVIVMAPLALILGVIDNLIRPAYFEVFINYGEISIKSFNPNTRNGLKFFLLIFYRKYLIEHKLDRQSYNNYRILIEKFGFKKSLILQKIENGKLYESKPINISFLGAKKYTDLILAIDRLKEKISLN